jgi:phosphotransferase system HPr (HPr) family protein
MSISKDLTVQASVGLHARPAAEFVKLAQGFNGSVSLQKEDKVVDGKSMIGILKLAIKQGETFTLTLDGENEEDYINNFEELVNQSE